MIKNRNQFIYKTPSPAGNTHISEASSFIKSLYPKISKLKILKRYIYKHYTNIYKRMYGLTRNTYAGSTDTNIAMRKYDQLI